MKYYTQILIFLATLASWVCFLDSLWLETLAREIPMVMGLFAFLGIMTVLIIGGLIIYYFYAWLFWNDKTETDKDDCEN